MLPFASVHLSDSDNELGNAERLGEMHVLLSLSTLFEAGLELARFGGDDENGDISLRGSHDHIGNVVLVSWCVDKRETLSVELEVGSAVFDSLAFGLFLLVDIHDVGQVPALSVLFDGFLFVFAHFIFCHFACVDKNTAGQSGFTRVDVADKHHVDALTSAVVLYQLIVLLRLLIEVLQLVLAQNIHCELLLLFELVAHTHYLLGFLLFRFLFVKSLVSYYFWSDISLFYFLLSFFFPVLSRLKVVLLVLFLIELFSISERNKAALGIIIDLISENWISKFIISNEGWLHHKHVRVHHIHIIKLLGVVVH